MAYELEVERELGQSPGCPGPAREIISGFSRYSNALASLPAGDQARLRHIAARIVRSFRRGCRPILTVHLTGHADRDLQRERAEPGFMLRISRIRAVAVRHALQQLIRDPAISSRIAWIVRGAGAARSVEPNPSSERARLRNRRVEVFLSTRRPGRLPVEQLRKIIDRIALRLPEAALRNLQAGRSVSLTGMSPAEYRAVLTRAKTLYPRGNSLPAAAEYEFKPPAVLSGCKGCSGLCFVLSRVRGRNNRVIRIHCLCFGFLFVHYCCVGCGEPNA
jgi:hypothetical protein